MYIMRNTGQEELQAVIKIAGRNMNNLRYADDTTLMEESVSYDQCVLLARLLAFVLLHFVLLDQTCLLL